MAFTHSHSDHIGCHAGHLVAEPEWARREPSGETDALTPRVRTVEDGQEVFRRRAHAEYVLTSGGHRLIAFGDAVHSPIQIENPDWSCGYDRDPAEAASHRRKLVAELAGHGTIGYGNHFADVLFGHVRDGRWTARVG
ncbi:hypothetical protein [Amycolatopsis rubida]|uniref:Metallo-beta-lactamase superfamily protein n=1 Tax=Amycolatopsis rubida TaxID=112413 RepID=A0A1I5TX06_9PSEU|nr:hypothetical protein [Amycolatopsis rubida]SFP87583.1 hypothetical protein SAMN05421854_107281 [Amycolatopsis rubida]